MKFSAPRVFRMFCLMHLDNQIITATKTESIGSNHVMKNHIMKGSREYDLICVIESEGKIPIQQLHINYLPINKCMFCNKDNCSLCLIVHRYPSFSFSSIKWMICCSHLHHLFLQAPSFSCNIYLDVSVVKCHVFYLFSAGTMLLICFQSQYAIYPNFV